METTRKTLGEKLLKRPSSNLSASAYTMLALVFVFSFFLLAPSSSAQAATDLTQITDKAVCAQNGGVWDDYVGCQAQNNVSGITNAITCTQNGGVWDDYVGCQAPAISGTTGEVSVSGGTASPSDPAAAARSAAEEAKKKLTGACGTAFWETLMNPVNCWLPGIANWVLGLAANLLWMAGVFLNYAAVFTLNLSSFADKLNIDATWATIRDLMNIVFIFALLWVSINTILGLGNDAKKLLASIIISALLINFSLFFTKVVIDVSNVVALQFYTGITGGKFLDPNNAPADGGISDQFMARLKLTSIYSAGKSSGLSIDGSVGEVAALSNGNVVTSAIMGTIFIIITAFVFFAAGLMLAARSAVLVILMVTSPIGFIGSFIPKLGTYTKKWQEELTNQALFAPIFFMLIWMVLKMTENKTGGDVTASFAAAIASGDATFISVIFNYVILIAFIVAALTVAKELSGKAGKLSAEMFGKGLNLGGFALRNTMGRGAAMLAGSERFKDLAGKDTRWGRAAMLALKGTEGVAKSTFNPMALGDTKVGKLVGAVGGAAGVTTNLGKVGGVGGYRKAEQDANKARIKKQEEAAKLLEETPKSERERKAKFEEEEKPKKDQYDADKTKWDAEQAQKAKDNAKERARLEAYHGSEEAARTAYESASGKTAGDYDKEFKEIQFREYDGGKFQSSKTINEARKGVFAQQLKNPVRLPGTNMPATTAFSSSVESDIQAGEKIGKASEDLNKIQKEIEDMNENLGKLLTKALGQQIDAQKVTSEQIRKAVSELNAKASDTRDEIRENKNMTKPERKARHSEASLYESDAREINFLRVSLERIKDRLDRKTTDAKNSASKGEDKPKEDKA